MKSKSKKEKVIEVAPVDLSKILGRGKSSKDDVGEKPRKKHRRKAEWEDDDDSDPVVGGVAGALQAAAAADGVRYRQKGLRDPVKSG